MSVAVAHSLFDPDALAVLPSCALATPPLGRCGRRSVFLPTSIRRKPLTSRPCGAVSWADR